jgi:phosphoribosylamine-glycine ligase
MSQSYSDYAIAPDQEERATYKVFSNFEDLQQSSVFSDYGKVLDENWEGLGGELSALAREDAEKFVEKMAAINLQFRRDIANALEAELVIRID